jgi:hypothetical protein
MVLLAELGRRRALTEGHLLWREEVFGAPGQRLIDDQSHIVSGEYAVLLRGDPNRCRAVRMSDDCRGTKRSQETCDLVRLEIDDEYVVGQGQMPLHAACLSLGSP